MTIDAVYLEATGVAATDTAALQAAIDSFTFTTAHNRMGTVVLSGDFKLTSMIQVGDPSDATLRPVALMGANHAALSWVGASTTDYILRYCGPGIGGFPRISGLLFDGNDNARGIFMDNQEDNATIEHCYFRDLQGVALDIAYCPGILVADCIWAGCRGIDMRVTGCDSMRLRTTKFCGHTVHHVGDATLDDDLAKYEMANGRAAAITYYNEGDGGPDNYGTSWPAADETTVQTTFDDSYIQTAVAERALVVVKDSNNMLWQAPDWEPAVTGEDPMLYLAGNCNRFLAVRMEGNVSKVKVLCAGGKYNVFEGISIADGEYPVNTETKATCFMKCTGTTGMNVVTGLYGNAFSAAIIQQDGGAHYGNTVTRCGTWYDEIAAENWKTTINDGVNSDDLPIGEIVDP